MPYSTIPICDMYDTKGHKTAKFKGVLKHLNGPKPIIRDFFLCPNCYERIRQFILVGDKQ